MEKGRDYRPTEWIWTSFRLARQTLLQIPIYFIDICRIVSKTRRRKTYRTFYMFILCTLYNINLSQLLSNKINRNTLIHSRIWKRGNVRRWRRFAFVVRFLMFALGSEWLQGDYIELQSIRTSVEETLVGLGYFLLSSGLMATSHERYGSFYNAVSILDYIP
jgi:hypothetical protein